MSDIVERLLDWSEHDEGKINDAREEAAETITRLTAEIDLLAILATYREEYLQLLTDENNKLRAALEKAEGGFYNMAFAIDDYDYHGPAPQCTGDIIGHREQLVKYAEECRAALGFTPLHKETSND